MFYEFTARLLRASGYSLVTLWLYIMGINIMISMIFYTLEMLIYKNYFIHFGDLAVSVLSFSYYGYCTWILGNIEKIKED